MNDTMNAVETDARGNRRRNYVINPAFQWKYAIIVGLAVFLLSTIMSSVLYGVLHSQARLRALQPDTYVAEITMVLIFAGLSFAALTAAGVAVWSFVITHRICGPLSVIAIYLKQLASGSIPKTRALRKKDEFKDFYAIFNDTLDSLKDAKRDELASLDELRSQTLCVAGADEPQRQHLMNDLLSRIDGLRSSASTFLGEKPDSTTAGQEQDANREEPVFNS